MVSEAICEATVMIKLIKVNIILFNYTMQMTYHRTVQSRLFCAEPAAL